MNNRIPITDEQKAFIANGIYRAVSQEMPELISEHRLPTSIGSGLFRWNFINRNLSDNLLGDFETFIQPRGAFRLLLLRDLNSNFTFSVMTETNFRKVQRSNNASIHYLEALVSENKSRKPIEDQMCFFADDRQRDSDLLFTLRNQLLSGFSGIVEEHILILFDYNFAGVTAARAVLLTPKMEIALSEDWTRFLKATVIPRNTILNELADDDEILATLKPRFTSEEQPVVKLPNESQAEKNA